MKEEFFAFLKKHKAYKKWLKYCERNKGIAYLDTEKPCDYIWCAFNWANANEANEYNPKDHNFWNNIRNKWSEYLYNTQS